MSAILELIKSLTIEKFFGTLEIRFENGKIVYVSVKRSLDPKKFQ